MAIIVWHKKRAVVSVSIFYMPGDSGNKVLRLSLCWGGVSGFSLRFEHTWKFRLLCYTSPLLWYLGVKCDGYGISNFPYCLWSREAGFVGWYKVWWLVCITRGRKTKGKANRNRKKQAELTAKFGGGRCHQVPQQPSSPSRRLLTCALPHGNGASLPPNTVQKSLVHSGI